MKKIYSILKTSQIENNINYLIEIDFSCPVFKGHFPKKPILPGVMMCDIVRYLVSTHLGVNVQLILAKNIKFSKIIEPKKNNTYNVKISINNDQEKYKVKAVFTQNDDAYFKLNAEYTRK